MNLVSQDPQSPLHKHHDFYFVLAVFALFFAGDLMWNQVQEIGAAEEYAASIAASVPSMSNEARDARDAARLEREISRMEANLDAEADEVNLELTEEETATDSSSE